MNSTTRKSIMNNKPIEEEKGKSEPNDEILIEKPGNDYEKYWEFIPPK
jgi:hypothetical protein